jgi:hypothetical protein
MSPWSLRSGTAKLLRVIEERDELFTEDGWQGARSRRTYESLPQAQRDVPRNEMLADAAGKRVGEL